MAAIFGAGSWRAHAPDETIPDWQDILGEVTLAGIARALEKLQANTPKFPPGAPAFRRLCSEFQQGTFAGGPQRPLPSVVQMLEGATVTGSARVWLEMCKTVASGAKLTRAELERLPAVHTSSGHWIRPADYCTASDDAIEGELVP